MTNFVISNVPTGATDIKVRRNEDDSTIYALGTSSPGTFGLLGTVGDLIQLAPDFNDGAGPVWSTAKPIPPFQTAEVTNADAELSFTFEVNGDVTLEVTGGSPYNGTYTILEAEYGAVIGGTPLSLVRPLRTVTPNPIAAGEDVVWREGFFLYEEDAGAVTQAYPVLRDGVEIAGSDHRSYTIVAEDQGTSLTARHSVTQGAVTVNSDSDPFAIPA